MKSVTQKTQKSVKIFSCEQCHFTSCNKYDYSRHCLTAKHKNVTDVTDGDKQNANNVSDYLCSNCNKYYKSRNGLWCHSKKCTINPSSNKIINNVTENHVLDTNLILKLIQQNENLQNLLMQQSNEKSELINKFMEREPGNNNTINGNVTNNNNNQKFNLNIFLNETCKDAMNIHEFIENLQITFQDLLKIGNEGFITGMSDIFIKELRELDVSKRPIHCTDSKRETIYFKQEDVWNKDDKEKTRLKQLIEKVEYKNVVALRQWCVENPDANVNNSDNNLLRDKIYLQTLQGDDPTRDKIIKNMVKQIIVDKEPEH